MSTVTLIRASRLARASHDPRRHHGRAYRLRRLAGTSAVCRRIRGVYFGEPLSGFFWNATNSKLIPNPKRRINTKHSTFAHRSWSAVLRVVISAVGTCLETLPIGDDYLAPRQPDNSSMFQIV
jgi:hypothetical protein